MIKEFWSEFLRISKKDANTSYIECFYFHCNEKGANGLLKLVLEGKKTATSSRLLSYEKEGVKLPQVGDYSIVTDWDGNPHCVIETVATAIIPFKDMTFEICKREGEDDNLQSWRKGHIEFFTQDGKDMGYEFNEDMLVLFEDFRVVFRL